MNKVFQYFKDVSTSRFAWFLIVSNLLFFVFLAGEINYIQSASQGYCDENGIRHFAFVEPSRIFQLFVLINLPAIAFGQLLNEIIFWNFNDPCISYSYDKYPLIYLGKTAILLICQSIQWFLVGYLIGRIHRKLKEY